MPTVEALIGLGSNIDPWPNLRAASARLASYGEIRARSSAYETEPVGAPGTPVFVNAALILATELDPYALKFMALRSIEKELGRTRDPQWPAAPRTIDLDIMLFGNAVIVDKIWGLVLPAPDLHVYGYQLLPAVEIAANWVHPTRGKALREIEHPLADHLSVRRVESSWSA